jgi:hypothetical protein
MWCQIQAIYIVISNNNNRRATTRWCLMVIITIASSSNKMNTSKVISNYSNNQKCTEKKGKKEGGSTLLMHIFTFSTCTQNNTNQLKHSSSSLLDTLSTQVTQTNEKIRRKGKKRYKFIACFEQSKLCDQI